MLLESDRGLFDRRALARILKGQARGRANSERLFGLVMLASIVHLWVRSSQRHEESRAALARQLDVQREFIADAAHELRTPLTAVSLQLENLRRDVPQDSCKQSFAQLEGGGEAAQRAG